MRISRGDIYSLCVHCGDTIFFSQVVICFLKAASLALVQSIYSCGDNFSHHTFIRQRTIFCLVSVVLDAKLRVKLWAHKGQFRMWQAFTGKR